MPAPAQNIELKARIGSLEIARRQALQVATQRLGVERQCDTYFFAPQGRLKLREIEGHPALLVAYHRENSAGARPSNYLLIPVTDPAGLRDALAMTLGVRVAVCKRREIFLHHQVRIHLDEVEGLGAFIEFEAVVGTPGSGEPPAADAADGFAKLRFLQEHFGIGAADLIESSYGDMLSP